MSLYRHAIDAAPRPRRPRDGGGAAHDRSPPRRSTTLASSGFRIKFAALFFGGRLVGERPPRCAMAWAGADAASHEAASLARAAQHVPSCFYLEAPKSRAKGAYSFFQELFALDPELDARVASCLRMINASNPWRNLPRDDPRILSAYADEAAAAAALAERRRDYDAAFETALEAEGTATELERTSLLPGAPAARQTPTAAVLYETAFGERRPGVGLHASVEHLRARWASDEADAAAVAACRAEAARLAEERVDSQRALLTDSTGGYVGPRGHLTFDVPLDDINELRRAAGLEPLDPPPPRPRRANLPLILDSWKMALVRDADSDSDAAPAAPESPTETRRGRQVRRREIYDNSDN